MEEKVCKTSDSPKLIFSCSGAADVGELADRAARKLTKDGMGNMFCLAGIGGRIGGIMQKTKTAQTILAIDGCALNCTKKCLEEAGFEDFKCLQLEDIGLMKGETEVNDLNIAEVVSKGSALLEMAHT